MPFVFEADTEQVSIPPLFQSVGKSYSIPSFSPIYLDQIEHVLNEIVGLNSPFR